MTEAPKYRRVQVWFGKHQLIDNTLEADRAEWFADAMRQRWAGLPVTNEPVDLADELVRR
jgi:hypothetical protein